MFDTNVKLIRELKEFVSIVSTNNDLLSHFRCSPKDFVRSRKLPFERLVLLITKLCKKTLSVEIEDFLLNQVRLTVLFLSHEPKTILQILHDFFKKELIPIRKGRKFERLRKNPHSKSKYKTFTNFKPAY